MSPVPVRKAATYADLLQLPENVVGQIIDGDLYAMPRPSIPHAVGATGLSSQLGPAFGFGQFGGPGGWWILAEPELHLSEHVLVPDLAGWRKTRMPKPPQTTFIDLAPDWVCEILSPSTEHLDRKKKRAIYAQHRIPYLWLVDPARRTLEALRLSGDLYSVIATWVADDKARIEPFDAIEFDLNMLWVPGEDSEVNL